MSAADEVPARYQGIALMLCSAQSGAVAERLQTVLMEKTPVQMVAVLADVMVGIAQGAAVPEETFRLILAEVVRHRFDRGWVFGGPPPGVEPS